MNVPSPDLQILVLRPDGKCWLFSQWWNQKLVSVSEVNGFHFLHKDSRSINQALLALTPASDFRLKHFGQLFTLERLCLKRMIFIVEPTLFWRYKPCALSHFEKQCGACIILYRMIIKWLLSVQMNSRGLQYKTPVVCSKSDYVSMGLLWNAYVTRGKANVHLGGKIIATLHSCQWNVKWKDHVSGEICA